MKRLSLVFSVVFILSACGAHNTAINDNGVDGLSSAAFTDNVARIKAILDGGVNVDEVDDSGLSPLKVAIGGQKYESVKYLISRGADVNLETEEDFPPLFYLCYVYRPPVDFNPKQLNITRALIEAGANVNHKVGSESLLSSCIEDGTYKEVIALLKSKGAK